MQTVMFIQRRKRKPHRQGVIYVTVLSTALIIATVSLAAIYMTRVEVDGTVSADRIARAELMAQSAIDYAMARIKADSSWRTTYVHNQQNPSATWYAGASQD